MTITIFQKIKISLVFILLLIIMSYAGFMKEMLLITMTIVFHELGHIFWIILFKGKVKKFEIGFFGGNITIQINEDISILKKTLINLGGSNC